MRNKFRLVRVISTLYESKTLCLFVYPLFFCLTELQFGEPFPARLNVFLGGFLRRWWLQHKIRIGITGTWGHFTLEPAQTRAFQEENPRRVRVGPRGESRAQDRRWAAASLSSFWMVQETRSTFGLDIVHLAWKRHHLIVMWWYFGELWLFIVGYAVHV